MQRPTNCRLRAVRLDGLRLTNVLTKGSTVRVHAETTNDTARCPACSTVCRRVHGRCERRLLDAAVAGRETVVHLRVRRFFCAFAGSVALAVGKIEADLRSEVFDQVSRVAASEV